MILTKVTVFGQQKWVRRRIPWTGARLRNLIGRMVGQEASGAHMLYDMPWDMECADGTLAIDEAR
jgi:hypothetical protein